MHILADISKYGFLSGHFTHLSAVVVVVELAKNGRSIGQFVMLAYFSDL